MSSGLLGKIQHPQFPLLWRALVLAVAFSWSPFNPCLPNGPCPPSVMDEPASREIELFLGPLIVGYMLGTLLLGVLTVQIFLYYRRFPNDMLGIRLTAWFSFTVSLIFTGLTVSAAWNTFGHLWGTAQGVAQIDPTWTGIPPLNGLLGMTTQLFFAWRIYQLTRRLWYSCLICGFALLQCGCIFWFGIEIVRTGKTYGNLLSARIALAIDLWLGTSIACDLMITFATIFTLARVRQGATFKPTLDTLSRIIRFTMETGLITTIWAIIELGLWVRSPRQGFHFLFFLNRGKLYSVWLLSTLNSRTWVVKDSRRVVDLSTPGVGPNIWTDLRAANDFKTGSPFERFDCAAINVSTVTEVHREQSHEMKSLGSNTEAGNA